MLLLNKHDTLRAPVVEEGLCLLQTCGRRLRCGNHLCPAACHSGPCLPCPLSVTVSCACGRTAYTLPCGTEATAKPPVCHQVRVSCDFSTMNLWQKAVLIALGLLWSAYILCYCYVQACPVPRTCQHAAQLPQHGCHYGACPPCDHPCGISQVSGLLFCGDACLPK